MNNYFENWLTLKGGLENIKNLIKEIKEKPIDEFLENPKAREMLGLVYKLEAWFVKRAIINR